MVVCGATVCDWVGKWKMNPVPLTVSFYCSPWAIGIGYHIKRVMVARVLNGLA